MNQKLMAAAGGGLVLILLSVWLAPRLAGPGAGGGLLPLDQAKALAAGLQDHGLTAEAAREYADIARIYPLPARERANLHYLAGTLYLDKVRDYDQASAQFLRARHLDPGSPQINEVNQKLVEALEKAGRSVDAEQELRAATALDPSQAPGAGTVLAEVGSARITERDFARRLAAWKQAHPKDVEPPDLRRDTLRDLVGAELVARAARRQGLDRDPDLSAQIRDIENALLAGRYMQTQLGPKPDPKAAAELEQRLLQAQDVKVFWDRIPRN